MNVFSRYGNRAYDGMLVLFVYFVVQLLCFLHPVYNAHEARLARNAARAATVAHTQGRDDTVTTTLTYTPRQRMLNAYLGQWSDCRVVAPEFWYYLPARVMGLDMVTFAREVPHWKALQETFRHYQTEGWGIVAPAQPNPAVESTSTFESLGEGRYQQRIITRTRYGTLSDCRMYDVKEPSWHVERPIKNLAQDYDAWLETAFPPLELMDFTEAHHALQAVGEDYLLEVMVGGMFFDFMAQPMGMEEGVMALADHEDRYLALQQRFNEHMTEKTRLICEQTADAPIFIACSWSCASLMGPNLWRRWDLPGVKAIVDEAHRHGRLVHIHYHGKIMDNLPDLIETGVDCICPFERLPGGDVTDLALVRRMLGGAITMNGNVHTVERLIRGCPADVEREVQEIGEAFAGEPRLIIGTGDQVGGETPDENIHAMVEASRRLPVG